MSFWSDSSPIVKGAVAVGALGLVGYIVAVIALGWPLPFGYVPFPPACTHCPEGEQCGDDEGQVPEEEGCPEGSHCGDNGECVQDERGFHG
jgi:hypothetical protein